MLAAYAAVLSVVPSGAWRTAVGLGVPLGWSEEHLRLERIPGEGARYVISLTALTLGAALLTLGLVQRWGDVVPGWVPVVGGFADDPNSGWARLMALCYAPALLW